MEWYRAHPAALSALTRRGRWRARAASASGWRSSLPLASRCGWPRPCWWRPGRLFNDEAYYSTLAELIADGEGFIRPARVLRDGLSVPTAERAPAVSAGAGRPRQARRDRRRRRACSGCSPAAARSSLLGCWRAGSPGSVRPDRRRARRRLPHPDRRRRRTHDRVAVRHARGAGALLAAYRLLESPEPRAGRSCSGRSLAMAAPRARRGAAAAAAAARAAAAAPGRARGRGAGLRGLRGACCCPGRCATSRVRPPGADRHRGRGDAGGRQLHAMYYGDADRQLERRVRDLRRARQRGRGAQRGGREGIDYALDHASQMPRVARHRVARTWGLYWTRSQRPRGASRGSPSSALAPASRCCCRWPCTACSAAPPRRAGRGSCCTPLITVTLTTLLAYGNSRFRHSAELSIVVLAAVASTGWRPRSRPADAAAD